MNEFIAPRIENKEEFEKRQILEWLRCSHFWINPNITGWHNGVLIGSPYCKWCNKISFGILEKDATLCLENPEIKKIIK